MDVGLHALGIGAGAERTVIDAVAAAAERAGFATLWVGEHVLVDESAPALPFSEDTGRTASDAGWLDPFVALSFAASATTRIGLATGVLLLPVHHPVLVAKQAASLDRLSGGRFVLGVGVGWSREEFEALGVPFGRRAERSAEYVEAMRTIWRDDRATFHGEFVSFDDIRVDPKPQARGLPVVVGGYNDDALNRAAAWGDGWYGFNLADVEEAAGCAARIRSQARALGREPDDLRLSVALRDPGPGDAGRLADAGIDEMVLVATPPADPIAAESWVDDLARRWLAVLN